MHAFVLGLERDFRGSDIVAQCQDAGITVDVFYGLDARHADAALFEEIASPEASRFVLDRPMSRAEIACAWGHQQIHQRLLSIEGAEWALVLEDDARLDRDPRDFAEALDELNDSPTVVTLIDVPEHARYSTVKVLEDGTQLVRLSDPPDFTVGYFINQKAAKLAQRAYQGKRIDSVSDWPYRWSRSAQFWAIRPSPVSITAMESLLEADRSVLQAQATMRVQPEVQHLLLSLLGIRLLRGLRLGYSPNLVLRHDFSNFRCWLHERRSGA